MAKGKLTEMQLKHVIRGASMGSRIVADEKIVWTGTASTLIMSREAKAVWDRKGEKFEAKMRDGKFKRVQIKDPSFNYGPAGHVSWLTNDDFNTETA